MIVVASRAVASISARDGPDASGSVVSIFAELFRRCVAGRGDTGKSKKWSLISKLGFQWNKIATNLNAKNNMLLREVNERWVTASRSIICDG